MNDHSDPNPGESNQDDLNRDEPNRSQGRHHRRPDGGEPMESGVLPEDFGRRLERLKEYSGLSWRGLARALGVDHKRLGQWRKGVEPCGGAMHSIHRFGWRMPVGQEILKGEDYQASFFDEGVEDDDVDANEEQNQEVNDVNEEDEDREEDPDG